MANLLLIPIHRPEDFATSWCRQLTSAATAWTFRCASAGGTAMTVRCWVYASTELCEHLVLQPADQPMQLQSMLDTVQTCVFSARQPDPASTEVLTH